MWLTLTDPQVLALNPGMLTINILDNDDSQIANCWKCLTVVGMTEGMHGYSKDALEVFQKAVNVIRRDTGAVPAWLTSRVDIPAADAAKK